jgi:hypothetical protein
VRERQEEREREREREGKREGERVGEWERGREGERKTPGGRDCEGLVGMEKESDLLCCRSDQKGSDQRKSDEGGR